MASTTPTRRAGRCPRCWLQPRWCICAVVPTVTSRHRLLLLRHGGEARKTTNSGRIAALALDAPLHDWPGDMPELPPDAWMLFPDAPARPGDVPDGATVVVLDGTWAQARRMARRLAVLSGLRRVSLPPAPERPRLRRNPVPGGMATLEAVGHFVAASEPESGAALLALYDTFVMRTLQQRGIPRATPDAW